MLKRHTLVWVAVLGLGLDARAGLEGDTVSVEQHAPELGNVVDSRAVVVQAGAADSVVFGGQNATTIDVDPDSIHMTLGCDFSACNRITTSAAFNGFVVAGMDWSDPPGAPIDVIVTSNSFVGPARVELLPGAGSIAINLLFHAWKDGHRARASIVLGDVNGDEREDLSLRFDVEAAGLPPGTGEACLTGQIGGLPFVACDAVDVRP